MKLLILIAVVGVAYGEYLNVDHCEKGPALWCSNLHYAKKCGAVQHCMDTVWTKQINARIDGDPSCTVCQLMVTNSRQLLKNKADDTEVSNLIAKACHIIPAAAVVQVCKDVVTNYLPEILTLIKNERLDSQMVCSLVGICRGTNDLVVETNTSPAVLETVAISKDKLCDDCVAFVTDLRGLIVSPSTEAEVKALLESYCDSMGGLAGICKELVEQYAPFVFKYLANEVNPKEICAMFQLCKTEANYITLKQLMMKIFHANDDCNLCKSVITELKNIDSNPFIQNKTETFLETKICPFFGSEKDVCRQYVQAYAPILFQLLANTLDPVKICTEYGFCAAKDVVDTPAIILEAKSPMYHIVKADHSRLPAGKVDSSPLCVICEFVLKEVDNELRQNKSKAAVKNVLDRICEEFPSTIRNECLSFVSMYYDVIVDLLVEEIDPKMICIKIDLCTASPVTKPLPKTLVPNVFILKGGDSPICEACLQVVTYLDEMLKSNITAEDLEMILDKICELLPNAYKKECITIVDSYGQYILQLLSQLATPKMICEDLSLCTKQAKKMHTLLFKPHHLLGDKKCTYGPSYWCASHKNAENCKAVEHCEKHVWNN